MSKIQFFLKKIILAILTKIISSKSHLDSILRYCMLVRKLASVVSRSNPEKWKVDIVINQANRKFLLKFSGGSQNNKNETEFPSFSQEPNNRNNKHINKTIFFFLFNIYTYMRRLRGKLREWNWETKLRTEERELRSRGKTTISEPGQSDAKRALASSAALRLRAGSTNLAPLFANTRAVSAPIPDVAPIFNI